jgi:uncharacterized protein YjbI with pentapeptide repeats
VWSLHGHHCLVANSTWENVTITDTTFLRCTFRDTSFSNVHFLNCTFTDVDFRNVIFRDSLISITKLSGTSFDTCKFYGASWAYNSFTNTSLDRVTSHKSNWTYVGYSGMVVSHYSEKRKTENWVRLFNKRRKIICTVSCTAMYVYYLLLSIP